MLNVILSNIQVPVPRIGSSRIGIEINKRSSNYDIKQERMFLLLVGYPCLMSSFEHWKLILSNIQVPVPRIGPSRIGIEINKRSSNYDIKQERMFLLLVGHPFLHA